MAARTLPTFGVVTIAMATEAEAEQVGIAVAKSHHVPLPRGLVEDLENEVAVPGGLISRRKPIPPSPYLMISSPEENWRWTAAASRRASIATGTFARSGTDESLCPAGLILFPLYRRHGRCCLALDQAGELGHQSTLLRSSDAFEGHRAERLGLRRRGTSGRHAGDATRDGHLRSLAFYESPDRHGDAPSPPSTCPGTDAAHPAELRPETAADW